jgi:hypothetical protein
MKKLALAVALSLPCIATAQSPFDGDWKIDVKTIDLPAKPVSYEFRDGKYECKTCGTKVHVKANGSDQKVEGSAYFDTLAVKIIDKNNAELTAKKGGKVVSKTRVAVSVDTNSMQVQYENTWPNGEVVKGTRSYHRTAYDRAAPHLMSGSWKPMSEDKRSDNGLKVSYRSEGKSLSMSLPTGVSWKAEINGADAPVSGDPGVTHVAVKSTKKGALEETYKKDGKTVSVNKVEVMGDGKRIRVDWIDYATRTNGSHIMGRQ